MINFVTSGKDLTGMVSDKRLDFLFLQFLSYRFFPQLDMGSLMASAIFLGILGFSGRQTFKCDTTGRI